MFKLDLEKAQSVGNLPKSVGSLKKQESSRKTPTSALLTTPKPSTVCESQQAVENSSRDGNNRPPEKSVCRSGSNS